MVIKVSLENWKTLTNTSVYGQDFNNNGDVICEVETAPSFDFEELTEDYNDFTQLCCPNLWGNSKPAIAELKAIKEKIEYLGEKALLAETLGELDLLVQLKQTQERADEQDLLLFEIITGGGMM